MWLEKCVNVNVFVTLTWVLWLSGSVAIGLISLGVLDEQHAAAATVALIAGSTLYVKRLVHCAAMEQQRTFRVGFDAGLQCSEGTGLHRVQ